MIVVKPSHWKHNLSQTLFLSKTSSSLGFKIPSMEKQTPQVVCGQEALDLLNCVTDSSAYDQDKCLRFLQSLRECVLSKKVKKFGIRSQEGDSKGAADSATKKSS